MKKMNVKKFARTFLVLIAVFALACAFSSMAFAADGETAAAAPDNNMGIGMIAAALDGTLTLDKLEAMTCVCSVGLDMIAVPGSTTAETISAIIADEAAVGMVNSKTTAVRIIPVEGKDVGDMVELGGLLGSAPVMPVHEAASTDFIARGGRIPAPLQSLKN